MAKKPANALPDFMAQVAPRKFSLDPAIYFPRILAELGVAEADIDQYWIEVAIQCMKLDAQIAVRQAGLDPRVGDKPAALELKILNRPDWKLTEFPDITPERRAAAFKREGRQHYERLRGFVPAG